MTRTRLHYLSINLPSPSSSSLSIPTSTRRKRRSFLAKSQVNIMNTSTSFARREVPRRNLRRTSANVAELQRDEPSLNRRVQETQHATYHNRNNITSQLSTAGLREVLHRPASRTTSSPPHTPPTPFIAGSPPPHIADNDSSLPTTATRHVQRHTIMSRGPSGRNDHRGWIRVQRRVLDRKRIFAREDASLGRRSRLSRS